MWRRKHASRRCVKCGSCRKIAIKAVWLTERCVERGRTPNTTHSGLYVAKERGYFEQEGLDVKLVSPHVTGYKITPINLLDAGEADFALGTSEAIYGYSATSPKPKLQAVASVMARDISRIVTLKEDGIDRPAKLDGQYYASYASRFEGVVVKKLIQNDGGKGTFIECVAEDNDTWNMFLERESSACWVLLHWEGVEASMKGVELNTFALEDYGVGYTFLEVIFARTEKLEEDPDLAESFLRACRKGYTEAAKDPAAAAEMFMTAVAKEYKDHPVTLDVELVRRSQEIISQYFLDEDGVWGRIDRRCVERNLDWLSDNGLLTRLINSCSPSVGEGSSSTEPEGWGSDERIPREELDSRRTFTNRYLDTC